MIRAAVCLALSLVLAMPTAATESGWALLREGGHVVLMRHARAPGVSDPADFDIEDCRTQRNLSDAGESQARRIGALFAARAARTDRVFSSRYCRALDTARLAFGDALVEPFSALDRLSRNGLGEETALAEVLGAAAAFSGSGNMVMVTHAENISALTGQQAREGEAVIVRSEGETLQVLGRIIFN